MSKLEEGAKPSPEAPYNVESEACTFIVIVCEPAELSSHRGAINTL